MALVKPRLGIPMPKLSDYFDYRIDNDGHPYVAVSIRGVMLLRLPATNKGTAFSTEERIELGIEGLLPTHVSSLDQQLARLYSNYQKQPYVQPLTLHKHSKIIISKS